VTPTGVVIATETDLSARVAALAALLHANPACSVAVVDAERNVREAGPALAALGISTDGHPPLRARALVEVIAVSDIALLSAAAGETQTRGSAHRSVRLRDGQRADLHLVDIGVPERHSVVVIVPDGGAGIADAPATTAVEATPRIGEVVCDDFGRIVRCSSATLELLGYADVPLVGTAVVHLVHPDDRETAIANWVAAKEQRGVALRWRCRLMRADATFLWADITITNEVGSNTEVSLQLYDISAEVAATEALVIEREMLGLLTETLPVGVAKLDAHGRTEHANARLADLLAPLDPTVLFEHAGGGAGALCEPELEAAFIALYRDGVSSRFVLDHQRADGDVLHLEWTIRAALDVVGEVTGAVVCVADVTEATRLRDALEHRAKTDALTGCLNRSGSIAAIEHALARVGADDGVGLLFIDLDDFKNVNDSLGHAVGDAVLEVVASRLRAGVRPGDVVGRLGGDEFVVIAPQVASRSAALTFAERISGQLLGPAAIAGCAVSVTASIGVAWSSGGTVGALLGAADAAMYLAKDSDSALPVLHRA